MTSQDDRAQNEALEAELRCDRLADPGDAFFADLEQRVMRRVAERPAPRRPWWRPGPLWRWVWRPAPVAALAGAAAVALVVLWVGGPGGPEEVGWVSPPRTPVAGKSPARPAPKGPASYGEAWFAHLPPTDDLWALEDRDLPALLALLSAEDFEEDDAALSLDEPVGEQSLYRLSEDQLRVLEREVEKHQTRPMRRPARPARPARPRPSTGQAG